MSFHFGISLVYAQSDNTIELKNYTMNISIKIQITKVLAAILLVTAGIPISILAKEKPANRSYNNNTYRRISIRGNVDVTIIQTKSEGISYAEDNSGNVKVIQNGDMITITSTSQITSKLLIYVNDIYRIEAMDNVVLKTEGKITTKFLQIFLKGNAQAYVYSMTESLYTAISDNAKLRLSGTTNNYRQAISKAPKLNMEELIISDSNSTSKSMHTFLSYF
jgi:hypothetical protein